MTCAREHGWDREQWAHPGECIQFSSVAQSCLTLCDPIQSLEFSKPAYWSGLPFPSPGDLPNPGIEPRSPALQVNSLPAGPQGTLWGGINRNSGTWGWWCGWRWRRRSHAVEARWPPDVFLAHLGGEWCLQPDMGDKGGGMSLCGKGQS